MTEFECPVGWRECTEVVRCDECKRGEPPIDKLLGFDAHAALDDEVTGLVARGRGLNPRAGPSTEPTKCGAPR